MQRRDFLKNSALTAGLVLTAIPTTASAKKMTYKNAYKSIVGSKKVSKDSDKIKLVAPEIAENGKVVPMKVSLNGIHASKVKSLHLIASENSNPRIADVFFTSANEEVYFQTRFKMGKSQDLVALIVMKDGSVLEKKKNIKITIGGCG